MNPCRFLQTHGGILVFGALTFGSAMIPFTQDAFPRMRDVSSPGTIMPIVVCYLLGLCWGEGVWQLSWTFGVLPSDGSDA